MTYILMNYDNKREYVCNDNKCEYAFEIFNVWNIFSRRSKTI